MFGPHSVRDIGGVIMRIGIIVAVALAAVSLPAMAQNPSEPKPRSSGFSLEDLSGKLSMVESLSDMTSWFGAKPDPIPEFSYIEKRRFDMQLNQSLNAKLPIVNVRVDGAFSRDAIPERMSQWLKAIEKSGGSSRYCVVESSDRSLLALLGAVLKLTKQVDKWLLYKPAASYDALVVTDGEGRVLNAAFTERGAVTACPEGTQEVSAGATTGK